MTVEKDQVWSTRDQNEFLVLEVVDIEDHTWVHYRNIKTGQEYSCYVESFKQRFTPEINRY
jgi:hypothetical protein